MKVSDLIKSAWMSGWNSANSGYTDWSRDLAWKGSESYLHYLEALKEEKNNG